MHTTIAGLQNVTTDIRNEALSRGQDRQAEDAGRALGPLKQAAERQRTKENRQWATLDAQLVETTDRLETARARGDARACGLLERARDEILKGMERLLGGRDAIKAALPSRSPAVSTAPRATPRRTAPVGPSASGGAVPGPYSLLDWRTGKRVTCHSVGEVLAKRNETAVSIGLKAPAGFFPGVSD